MQPDLAESIIGRNEMDDELTIVIIQIIIVIIQIIIVIIQIILS